jgi:hypothetical protein
MNSSNKVEKRKEKDEGWEMGKEFWDGRGPLRKRSARRGLSA